MNLMSGPLNMRGLYFRSLLLLVWLMAIAIAVGVLPHRA